NVGGNRICRDHVLSFDASASSAADGSSIVRYQWDFDLMNDDPTESSFDHVATTTHSYPFEDLYFPTVTVTSEYQCTSFDVDEDIDTLAILDPPAFTGLTIRDFEGALISEECERDIVTFATGAEYRDNTPGRPSPGNLNPPDNDTDLSFSLIYDWDYDDGTTYTDNALSDTSTVTHPFTFRTSNQFTTTVEVRDSGPSFSCSSVTSIPLIVHPLPDASYDVLFEGDNTIVPGSACEGIYLQYENTSSIRQGLFDPSNLASYSWLFGDDSTSTDTSPRHEYLKEGDYDIQLVATSTKGCVSDTTTYHITVHPAPDGALFQDVYASPDSICVGESTTFVNQTTIPTGTVNYDWDFGDGVTSTDISPTHTYSAGGTYRARLQRTSDQGCTNSISPIFVQVNALPAANFSFADPCEGEPTQFFNSSFVQGAAMDRTFSWAFNDGTNSHLSDPLRTFSPSSFDASGQAFFDVSLTVTTHASTTACSDTETKRLTVNRRPTFDFGPVILSAGDTLLNPNNDVQSFLPAGSDYQWTDVLGNPLSNNEALTVTASGTYQLSVQTPNPALCDSTFSIPVFILGAIDLGADRTICVDEVLVASPTVANSISPSSYAWYKDGIPIDGENSVQLFVNATGVYTVEATYELLGESAITRGEVMINRVAEGSGDPSCDSRLFPTVNLGPDVFSCEPSVTFHAGNPGSTYRWSNGSTNPTLTVTESGEYTVTVTGANGNQSSDNVLVEFLSNPKPILGDDFEACDRTSLSAGREASTYQWSTGAETPSIDVTRTGEYWVQTVAENLCVNSDTVHVTIREIPVFELGSDTVVCEGESITLSVDVPGTYAWSTGERTPSIEVDTSAIYSLVVTSEYGCTYEDSRQTTFNPKPVLSLLDAYEACDSIDLIAGSETYSYTWLDGTTGPTLSVSTTGEYSVTATTAQGCEETLTTDVTVFPSPSPALRGSTFEACFGEVVTLDVGDENATYDLNWNTGSTARNLAASASGIYQVRVTSDAGCSILDSAEVIIREAIPLDLAPLVPFCGEGLTEISSGLVGDYTYAWSGPNGQSGNDSFFSPDTTGVYVLTVRDGFGCLAQDSVELFVSNQRVEASFLIPSNVIQGDVVHFIALTGANDNLTYFWDFGDGATSTASDAQYQYTTPGTYAVTLTISNGTCSHSLTKEIVVQDASNRFDGDDSAFGFVEVVVAKSYPNPAVDQIALELEFSRPIAISISIRDIRGYEVARYEAEDFTQETVSFDLAGLRQGMYFFNIQYGKSARNLKFIKR
ncbi:MAG: PKD domain-containing protein, partial [Bacteroidota bacterium]